MAGKLIRNVTLTRSASGWMTDIRKFADPFIVDPNSPYWSFIDPAYAPTVHNVCSARPSIRIQLSSHPNHLSYAMEFDLISTPIIPNPHPVGPWSGIDEYLVQDGGRPDTSVVLNAVLTDTSQSGVRTVLAQDPQTKGTYNACRLNIPPNYQYTGVANFLAVEWTQSEAFSISVTGSFDLYADYDNTNGVGQHRMWSEYSNDHDPYGSPPRTLQYYYVSYDNKLHVNWTFGSSSGSYDVGIGSNDYPSGLDPFTIIADVCSPNDCNFISSMAAFSTPQKVVSISLNNVPGDPITLETCSYSQDYSLPYYQCLNNNDYSTSPLAGSISADVNNNVFEVYTIGFPSAQPSAYCELAQGPYTITHAGNVRNLDGSPVANALVKTSDGGAQGYTEPSGSFGVSHHYAGAHTFGVTQDPVAYRQCLQDVVADGAYCESSTDHHYNAGSWIRIVNAATLAGCGLDFPFPVVGHDLYGNHSYDDYLWFNDSRMEMAVGDLAWSPALRLSAPYSKVGLTFSATDAAKWTATNAAISSDGDALKVTPSADGASISRNYAADTTPPCLAGARYVHLVCDSNDSEPINVTMGGRSYSVVPGGTIDLLACGGGGSDASPTAFNMSQPSLGFGLNNPGTMTISGLRSGKTYTLDNLTLIRRGPISVRLTDGSFVGIEPGGHSDDPMSLFSKDGAWWSRKGIVTYDGIVAAELMDTYHYETPSYEGDPLGNVLYHHLPVYLSGGVPAIAPTGDFLLWPLGGMVSHGMDSASASWQANTLESWFLMAGTYTESDSSGYVDIPFEVRSTTIEVPVCYELHQFNYDKQLKGIGWVRVYNLDGSPAANAQLTVTPYTLDPSLGGVPGTSFNLACDVNGECLMPSNLQPQVANLGFGGLVGGDPTKWSMGGSGYANYQVFWEDASLIAHQATVSSHTDGVMSVPGIDAAQAPTTAKGIYVLLDNRYEVAFTDGEGQTWSGIVEFRNRNWALVVLRGVPSIHGLLYDIASNQLQYDPANGKLQYI